MVVFFVLVAIASYGVEGRARRPVAQGQRPVAQFLANVAGALVALAAYPLLVWPAEGRTASELSPRAALTGSVHGLRHRLRGVRVGHADPDRTGLYTFDLLGGAPVWTGAGLSIESGFIEEIWPAA